MSGAAEQLLAGGVYLKSCLAPFADALSRADVSDIYVNAPGELWLETVEGAIERHECDGICEIALARFARQVAALTNQGINREHPLLGATLPDGSRVQVIAPPATRGPIAIAIRRHISRSATLQNFADWGAFSSVQTGTHERSEEKALRHCFAQGNFASGLALAVRSRMNIVVSGGTSSGKTTFLNALLHEIPAGERLIVIEDTPELQIAHPNSIGLLASRGQLGEATVTMNELVTASLRMRPDRIILGELRGSEAFAFLRAVSSGHPGSMTTIHAESPTHAVEQLALLIVHDGVKLSRAEICDYVSRSIDVFVQLGRKGGKRVVEAVTLGTDLRRGNCNEW